jgi:hypothetical protein
VRHPSTLLLFLLPACAAAPEAVAPAAFAPAPAVVFRLSAGTAVRTDMGDVPTDEPRWRAAGVWWHEALRQTTAFELRDEVDAGSDLPVLLLTIDAAQQTPERRGRSPVRRSPTAICRPRSTGWPSPRAQRSANAHCRRCRWQPRFRANPR